MLKKYPDVENVIVVMTKKLAVRKIEVIDKIRVTTFNISMFISTHK